MDSVVGERSHARKTVSWDTTVRIEVPIGSGYGGANEIDCTYTSNLGLTSGVTDNRTSATDYRYSFRLFSKRKR
jgi:hypothetical protein